MQPGFLIIDRNRRFINFIENLLRDKYPDSKIFVSDTLEQSLDTIKYNDIQVLICEDQLDHLERFFHFAEFLKVNPSLQIIATTSYCTSNFRSESICIGALEALEKPVTKQKMADLIEHAIELIEITNKKSLLLQDIIMLSKEGQVFPISTIRSLITSLENRFSQMKGKTSNTISIMKNVFSAFNFSQDDKTLLELCIIFFGVSLDTSKISGSVSHVQEKIKRNPSAISPDMIIEIIEVIKQSFSWHSGFTHHFNGQISDEDISIVSRVLAVILAFASLTSDGVLSPKLKPYEAIEVLRKFSSSRFDSTVVTAFISIFSNMDTLEKAN